MRRPRAPDDDVHDELSRQETLVEKSDAMAREFSESREIRLREERVRRLSAEPAKSPSRLARKKRTSSSRLSDPFPPLRKERPREKSAARADALPRQDPVAPRPLLDPEPKPTSAADQLAMELEELLRELRHGWRNLSFADRTTLISAVFVMAGVFMPWISDPAHPLKLGLFAGGILHLAIALAAIALVMRSAPNAFGGIRQSRREEQHRYRRSALWLVLLGAASTFIGAFLVLAYGLQKTPEWPVNLHFGIYWTLAAGTGLSYGGLARFSTR